ncbi:TetR/AcrR family transcriptional regulator [Streptococcus pyogenes]|uniref:TetR/AcrR family transcriptional regulator n=1 Tax=Streptococcus pyogenes TaxID=1314 RepID=UPI003204AE5D
MTKDRQIKKTKTAIYSAFTALLQKKEYSKITVRDMITLANVGRSTFYAHYESKEMLLKELCEELFHHLFRQKRNVTFEDYLVHILKHFEQNKDSIATLLLSNDPYFLLRFKNELEHDVYPNLRCKYIDKTTIPEVFLKQFVLSSFIETLKWWLHQRQRMSANELLKYYLEFIK